MDDDATTLDVDAELGTDSLTEEPPADGVDDPDGDDPTVTGQEPGETADANGMVRDRTWVDQDGYTHKGKPGPGDEVYNGGRGRGSAGRSKVNGSDPGRARYGSNGPSYRRGDGTPDGRLQPQRGNGLQGSPAAKRAAKDGAVSGGGGRGGGGGGMTMHNSLLGGLKITLFGGGNKIGADNSIGGGRKRKTRRGTRRR